MVYLDPVTGRIVNTNATATDLDSQAHRGLQVSNDLLSQTPQYTQQFEQAVQGEQGLVRDLNGVIAGTAPSVAQTQLQEGVGQIRQQADSMAGGVAGPGSALAHYQAMIQAGAAQAQANQQAALLRAQEVARAREAKGAVLANQATQTAGIYGTTLNGANAFGNTAAGTEGDQEKLNAQDRAGNKALVTNILNGLGSAAATYGSGSKGAAAGAA